MYQAKSRGCRLVDKHLGGTTGDGKKRHPSGSGTCEGTPHKVGRKEQTTKFERFATEGNQKADELAKAGAMLDEGFMVEARAEAMKQEREEVYVALQYAASFHCSVEEWKDCEEIKPKPKEQWVYRCMRCGRGSKYMKMPGKCTGPKPLEVVTWSEVWTDRVRY